MYDDESGFDIYSVDYEEPIAVEEVLHVTAFDDSAWLAFFDGAFDDATPEERRSLILNPVDLGRLIFSIPGDELREASPSVRELIGSLIAEKLLLRLPAIEAASA
jgi:hypothetical protein